jgi:hypothetical protein
MREVRLVRRRAGAQFWQLYEDVAHPEGWIEIWSMESWTDHLREVIRLSEDDRLVLARIAAFQHQVERPSRYLAVDPYEQGEEARRQTATRIGMPRPAAGLNSA